MDTITDVVEVGATVYDDGSFARCGRRIAFSEQESSVVDSMSYDSVNAALRITFRTGRIYDYKDIAPGTFGALAAAQSVGSTINELVRAGVLKDGERVA